MFLPDVFFPPEGVLAQLVWYPILWCDTTQSTVSRVLVWSSMFFKLKVFQHKKTTCHFWKSVVVSRPIRTNFRLRFVHYKFCPNHLCFFCSAHWIMLLLQVVSTTLHTFWELQHASMLPNSAKIAWIQDSALMLTKAQTTVQADNHKRLEVNPEGRSRNRKYIWIYTYTKIMYIHTYIHTYIHPCMHACMHAYIHT